MSFFNPFGTAFVAVILVPNIVFACKCKGGFDNAWTGKGAKFTAFCEQIGRYACLAFMVFNVPGTCLGFNSKSTFAIYLIANSALLLCYCVIWVLCFRKDNLFRAISLSLIPSLVFLLSGISARSVLLTVAAAVFAPCHITISVRNTISAR